MSTLDFPPVVPGANSQAVDLPSTLDRTEEETPKASVFQGILTSDVPADAVNCIIIGGLEPVQDLAFGRYENILLFRGRCAATSVARFLPSKKVSAEFLEGQPCERMLAVVERFIQLDWNQMPAVFITEGVMAEQTREYLAFTKIVFEYLAKRRVARNFHSSERAYVRQKHVLENLNRYTVRRVPSGWRGALSGTPACICGAGPSLGASIRALAACAERGVVMTGDSAMRALHKHGIAADFLTTIDERKSPADCVPAGVSPPYIITTLVSSPDWMGATHPDHVFSAPLGTFTEGAMQRAGIHCAGMPRFTSNCGIAAFQTAVYLGCAPILLFGMDHAVDSQDPSRLHTHETSQQLQRTIEAGAKLLQVPGNYQGHLGTTEEFFRAWEIFNRYCNETAPGVVYNVTDRGARLQNTTLVHPVNFHPAFPILEKGTLFSRLARGDCIDGRLWGKFRKEMRDSAVLAGKIFDEARADLTAGREQAATRKLKSVASGERYKSVLGNWVIKLQSSVARTRSSKAEDWRTLIAEGRQLCGLAINNGRI